MNDTVTCYSGARFAERPRSFQYGGESMEVGEVVRMWREPEELIFVVRTPDRRLFRLAYEEAIDRWHVEEMVDTGRTV